MAKKEQENTSNETPIEIILDDTKSSTLDAEVLQKGYTQNEKSEATSNGQSDKLEQDFEKLKSEYLYLRAEFDNFRKNSIKERSEMVKYGAERFIRQILSVMDNFDRALEMKITAENYQDFIAGIEMTSNEFKSQLSSLGLTIENPLDQAFDPTQHEALGSEESSEVKPGFITKVFQKGYKLHDKIIRPAQVIVAKETSGPLDNQVDSDNEGGGVSS